MDNRNILIVDDTKPLAEMYVTALRKHGYDCSLAHSGAELLDFLDTESFSPALIVLDIKLPDIDGLELLARLKSLGFDIPVVVVTGHASIHLAVEAMRLGATDFLVKPFPIEKLCKSTTDALTAAGLVTKGDISAAETERAGGPLLSSGKPAVQRKGFGGFIGISPPMQVVYDVIENAARSDATVFITGESGTGKEICAEAIHRLSRRADRPFIAINCAAIPRELLESELFGHVKGAFTGATHQRDGAVAQADGGTLFLDEIAEMTAEMQSKLLRFLQDLTYRRIGGDRAERANLRIVCATNRDPHEEIRAGHFRQDLYYRLHVIPIHMPPLRQRPGDVVDLADYFLKLYAREEHKAFRGFTAEAEKLLLRCPWPGNVRQLQNVVRGVVVMHDGAYATAAMLPPELSTGHNAERPLSALTAPLAEDSITPLWQVEKGAIEQAILSCEGNIPKAATLLEISPSTIYRKKMLWEQRDAKAAER